MVNTDTCWRNVVAHRKAAAKGDLKKLAEYFYVMLCMLFYLFLMSATQILQLLLQGLVGVL